MGAPFEGDICGKGLASEMPDWVKTQIEMDDYVDYLKPPVGTWNGKIYRVTIDSDCHTYQQPHGCVLRCRARGSMEGPKDKADSPGARRRHGSRCRPVTKFLKGKKVKGKEVYGYLDPPKPWGGFRLLFPGSRATAYAKHPGEKAWLFDIEKMKPLVNNPAWVRAIQDVVDALPSEPAGPDQCRSGHDRVPTIPAGTGSMLAWWGDIGSMAQHQRHIVDRRRGLPSTFCPAPTTSTTAKTGQWEKLASGPNFAPNMAYLGWGVYVMARVDSDKAKQKAAWSAAAHLGGKDIVAVDGGVSVGIPALSKEPIQHPRMGRRRLRQEVHRVVSEFAVELVQSPERGDRAAHPRHLPILQHRGGRTREDLCGQTRGAARRRHDCSGLGQD